MNKIRLKRHGEVMPDLRSSLKKVRAITAIYWQIILVFLAFTVMVISSYLYMERLMLARLEGEVNNALDFMQSSVENDLQEPEKLLQSVSQSMRNMIINGYNSDMIQSYIKEITPSVIKYEKQKLSINRMYGYFDVFNGLQLNNGEWAPTGDNNPMESPWYKAAVEANGKVVYTLPYFNARIRSYVLTYALQIFKDDQPLAVLAIDVPIDKVIDYVTAMQIVEDGYGMLVDENLGIIAHPDPYLIGKTLQSVNNGLASNLANYLGNSGYNIPKSTTVNYKGLESVVYSRKLRTDWYISLIAPVNQYYHEIKNTGLVLAALGLALALILSGILWRIADAKTKSDIKNRQKSNFLATMSHEIRTPMNAILGIAEIQLQDETLPHGIKDAFYKINNSGDLLIGIINDILDMSKIEAGKLEMLPAKYDVPSLINDIVQLNILRFDSKPIEFKLLVDENVPIELIGDELRIKQILNNLLSNAFKYTESGEVTLSITVEYLARGGAVHVTLIFHVSDTGQGMTAEQVRDLGNEYSRFNMEANRTTEGTGLGMSITQNLVQLMYGSLSVESKPGKGTTVTVRLPQRTASTGVSGMIGKELAESLRHSRLNSVSKMKKAKITREPMPYGKVLIVDDVESNLYVAKGLMASYELSIDTAVSGFEVIERIKNGNIYDVIFMDHMMPVMDGIETTKIIRGLGYKEPIVALTANALTGQMEIFLTNGFDGFISKPIDIRQLNASLNKLVRDKQPPEVIEAARRQRAASDLKKEVDVTADSSVNPQLKNIFKRDAEKAVLELEAVYEKRDAWNDDDIQMYIINVHAMKSALANIEEANLSGFASTLEQAGRGRDTALMAAETPAFVNSLREIIRKIKSTEDSWDSDAADEDKAYLKEKLLSIREFCASYDKKAAKDALGELRQKTWSRSTKELLNAITEHLLHSEFEKVADIVRNNYKDSTDNGLAPH
ncbi:MAG: response regulator [Treponema sp.]|jgi:signal transduction histidine kinase/CheY-like chemotaxis protein/HPt (histidine-containing phosphotransfer) domain-containing protein|nr:response regulator [Treponema sp.]